MNTLIPWSRSRLLGFRFFAVFFTLNIFPFPLSYIPGVDVVTRYYDTAWEIIVKWSGKHILQVPYEINTTFNGSGDTTFGYIQLFVFVTLALLAAVLWTVTDRKLRNYDRLSYWVSVYVRYYLAFAMLSYGFAKVIKTQFPTPSAGRLIQPLGEFSPMGLAWSFMGYSKVYNIFTGLGEVIGGLLLFWRRTVLAGVLLLLVVMGNVVAINFCFDVPVKLYSCLLFIMALWIAWPYRKRMYQFFIKNSDVLPHPFYNVVLKRWQKITLRVVKLLLIATAVGMNFYQNYSYYAESGDDTPPQEFEGVYDVQYFVRNRDTMPPLTTDTIRWRKLTITGNGRAYIRLMNDSTKIFSLSKDSEKKEWAFKNRLDSNYRFTLHYLKQDSTTLVLNGPIKSDSLHVLLHKLPINNFLLMNRGFHWINEYPFNR